jgi:Formamidopyrimidine-DNA glycosylase
VPIARLKDAKVASMRVHGRTGEACPVCGDTIRDFSFASTTAQYCPTCQTHGEELPLKS